ncbi:hypothetical protein [Microbacterium murale]|uniref:Cbb3-type cytochrome oxidase subunit 3 n=1 Tax=Microbacterium murale TaxID=1081040 RepID=A0ABU0P8R1_9MICO|nr:hypothetical protein [Microbacterium murale]MDQ0643727.1 cbb3-type cytochrome oxidase subunit 3 [Microbacterium murale]
MSAFALKYALIALAIVVVVAGVWWALKRPNRSKRAPARLRMPIFVPLAGWLLLAVGFLLALSAFTSRYTADLLPMRIASLVVGAGGVFFLVMYNNWYVDARADEVRFRTIFGREHVIEYADIVEYRMLKTKGQPKFMVRSSSGVKFSIHPQIFPVEPLLAAIRFYERTGRWPLVGEQR